MTKYVNDNFGIMMDGENVKAFARSWSGKGDIVTLNDDDFRSKFNQVIGFDFNPKISHLFLCVKPGEKGGTVVNVAGKTFYSVEDYLKSLESV